MKEHQRLPERTIGASTIPSLKSSGVRCDVLRRFGGGGGVEDDNLLDMSWEDSCKKVFKRMQRELAQEAGTAL